MTRIEAVAKASFANLSICTGEREIDQERACWNAQEFIAMLDADAAWKVEQAKPRPELPVASDEHAPVKTARAPSRLGDGVPTFTRDIPGRTGPASLAATPSPSEREGDVERLGVILRKEYHKPIYQEPAVLWQRIARTALAFSSAPQQAREDQELGRLRIALEKIAKLPTGRRGNIAIAIAQSALAAKP